MLLLFLCGRLTEVLITVFKDPYASLLRDYISVIGNFYCFYCFFYCFLLLFTVHFDKFKTSLPTNALFIKMLQLTLKIFLYMAPTCFSQFGPSSGSICQNLAKVTVFVELLVKVHR
jgi:hypothetical protein